MVSNSGRNSRMKMSRNKTNQSLHNDSYSRVSSNNNTTGKNSSVSNVFDRLYQESKKKKSAREMANMNMNQSKRTDSRVSINSQNNRSSMN